MFTLLFDIDGTLIRSGHAGTHAIGLAIKAILGIETLPILDVHGRTDRAILGDLFFELGLDYEQHIDQFNQLYWQQLPQSLIERSGEVLPGVNQLLEQLSIRSDVTLGLLTGNSFAAARIKLQHFGLQHFFDFGGYGDDRVCRNEVAELALTAAREHLQGDFQADRVWVIGDTINDIRCARAINSKVIAVETGGSTREDLQAENPDVLLDWLNPVSVQQIFA